MTEYDDYFTNDDKPFSENLNDSFLLAKTFDVDIPIEMPRMFNNGSFMNSTSSRKCGVAIVTLNSLLSNDLTINNEGKIFGSGTVQLKFYPNFNNFGKIKSISWDDNEDIIINLKKLNGDTIVSNISNGSILSDYNELKILQEIIIEIVFDDATLSDFVVTMQGKQADGYDVKIGISDIDELINDLTDIENKNEIQDERLDDIDDINTNQQTKLTNMETSLGLIRNYKITRWNYYTPHIDEDLTLLVEVTDKDGHVVALSNVEMLCTKPKANTYPYENETTTLTAQTNGNGVASFTINLTSWGMWDFQVGHAHYQFLVEGWREVMSADTYMLYRNQTRAKVILYGVSASSVTWDWKPFVNGLSAASIRPEQQIVSWISTGRIFIRIDDNGRFWYMVGDWGPISNAVFWAQIEWEICEEDL